ncbi:MAG: VOC family protein [Candidatus Gracilibacteria bacterium]|nr:VOC family protein [Candidatus Gracilibacteria bacterium]
MSHKIQWFIIPVSIFERANNFYNILLNTELFLTKDAKNNQIGIFGETDSEIITGCISEDKNLKPSNEGTIIYLDTQGNIDEVINQVIPAGGKIKMPKTSIGEHGYIAHIEDTEGNIIGLHDIKK